MTYFESPSAYQQSDLVDMNVSSYTQSDLIAALAKWQLDADRIFTIAEDLPAGSVSDACRQLYGEAGKQLKSSVVKVYNLEPVDNELFDAAMPCAFALA